MKNSKKFYRYLKIAVLVLMVKTDVYAQVNPLISMYYQNQYLVNPAMAGLENGLNINAVYKHELVGENRKMNTNALTLDYKVNKMGFGVNINLDKDGLINTNRYLATYAYHLNISEEKALHFGLSAGVTTEKLNTSDIIGDIDDELVMQYNQIEPSFDADFGIAYTDNNLSAQVAIPNMRDFLNKQDVDRIYSPTTFYSAISYKLKGAAGQIEPKIAYRGLKYYDNLIDAGINFSTTTNNFDALLMYHSSNNATLGVGFIFQKNYQFQLAYVTPTSSTLQEYSSGSLQVGLKLHFITDKK